MKAYIISQAEMNALSERLELQAMRAADRLGVAEDVEMDRKARIEVLHRSFNLVVCQWIDEVSR